MRHFWTTAAVAALCAISTPTWAAPQLQYLQLVASKHKTHASSAHAGKTAKSSKKKSKASSGKSSRRHARTRAERRAEARREQEESSTNVRRRGRRTHPAALRGEARPDSASSRRHRAVPSAIHAEAPAPVKVRRGDSLQDISDRTGVSVSELARLNRLKKPYRLKAGARIKLPERRYYAVKSGDTLFSLARRFGVDEAQLRSLNEISRRHGIRAGQKLYLPSDAKDSEAREAPPEPAPAPVRTRRPTRAVPEARPETTETEAAPPPVRTLPSQEARPVEPALQYARPPAPVIVNPRPAAMPPPPGEAQSGFELQPDRPPAAAPVRPSATTGDGRLLPQGAPAPTAGDLAAAGRGRFVWPAAGTLLSGFGPKADGQRNDGLNIAANPGDPVRAAAEGEVVYAGDQVPSFGNLVLIKHPGGWVTAYAHMSRILVKNRDEVTQGQEIGVVGQSGSVDRPQLHFEIRYAASPKDKAAPVDPMLLLPPR